MPDPILNTVGGWLYAALAPLAEPYDEARGYPLAIYSDAIGGMFQPILDLVDDPSALVDPDRTPNGWIPWLSQFVGVSQGVPREVPLAGFVNSDFDAWLTDPTLAGDRDRFVVFDFESTRDAYSKLVGPGLIWEGKTWNYINIMSGDQWGLEPGDLTNPFLQYSLNGDGSIRMSYDFPNQIAMDVRNQEWRRIVVADCVNTVNTLKHRGVFLDDFNIGPDLQLASDGSVVPTPDGWNEAVIQLAEEIRAAIPASSELVINLSLSGIAWNGTWVEWETVPDDPWFQALLPIDLIWFQERGFSDPNLKDHGYHEAGLGKTIGYLNSRGRKVVIDDQSGEDPQFQVDTFVKYVRDGWLIPSVDLSVLEPYYPTNKARQLIKNPPRRRRGTVPAIVEVVQSFLDPPRTVFTVERQGGSMYLGAISVINSEITSGYTVADIQAAVDAAAPAGRIITVTGITGDNWQALRDTHTDWSDIRSTFTDWAEVRSNPTKQ